MGLVLCGGQSLRMGRDKGMLQSGGKTWVEKAADLLLRVSPVVGISIRPEQTDLYKGVSTKYETILDYAEVPIMGPLKGILSAHKKYVESDIFVLAVDYVDMNSGPLEDLLRIYNEDEKKHEAFYWTTNGDPEPRRY